MARAKLAFIRGDAVVEYIQIAPNDVPMDFTGYTAAAQVRRHASDEDVAFEFDVTLDDPPAGESDGGWLSLALDGATSGDLASGEYVWDLELTVGGDPWTPVGGPLEVIADVTRL